MSQSKDRRENILLQLTNTMALDLLLRKKKKKKTLHCVIFLSSQAWPLGFTSSHFPWHSGLSTSLSTWKWGRKYFSQLKAHLLCTDVCLHSVLCNARGSLSSVIMISFTLPFPCHHSLVLCVYFSYKLQAETFSIKSRLFIALRAMGAGVGADHITYCQSCQTKAFQ